MSIAPSTGFRVRPAELAAAGEAARRAAERLRSSARPLTAAGETAVAALPGWRTAAALHECTEAWHRALARLAAELDTIGTDLHRTADNYNETEVRLQQSLTAG